MESFIIGLIVGIAVTLLIVRINRAYANYKRIQHVIDQAQDVLNEIEEKITRSTIEVDNNILFMYDKKTGKFLANGETFQELEEKVKTAFPGKLFDVKQEEIDRALEVSKSNMEKRKGYDG